MLKPSSTQEPTSSRARHTMLILQQSRNTALSIKRQAAQSHTKPIDTPKTHFWTLHCTPDKRDPAPLTRTQTWAPLTRKPWQVTSPTPPTGGRLYNKEEPQTSSLQKGQQQSKQNEKTEKYSAGKGTWLMPTKPNKRGGDRESTWKRIQNNDSKDDPKSWKQNGVTDKRIRDKDWEDARNV